MTLYASTTDFQRLYSPAHFGAAVDATSLTLETCSREILTFCAARGVRHVVNVGSGSGALLPLLRSAGIQVITCGCDPVNDEGIHFDLSGSSEEAAKVLHAVEAKTKGEPWLVTCLNILERMDIEDVYAAVRNLRAVCCDRGHLIASISTRPSSADNKFHATILPKPTWLEIFKTVGFVVDEESIFDSARAVRRECPDVDGLRLVSYWAKCDLFRHIGQGEPGYVLLSAADVEADSEDARRECVEARLDIGCRRAKREQFNAALGAVAEANSPMLRVGLSIHLLQEFILYRPLLDVLPREAVVVLVRTPTVDSDALSLMRGFFDRCGVQAIFYEQCHQIGWHELGLKLLLTGLESNVNRWHMLARQIVEAAKLHGIHTIQMQHGIWVEQLPQRLIDFGSETIWSWGESYERFIHGSCVRLAGKAVQAQSRPWQRYQPVGSPKFVDMRLAASRDLLRWRLGVDVSRYRAVALVGTNLNWHRHGPAAQTVRERLVRVMRAMPDVFFVVKLHPNERVPGALELAQSNALVLDDILMGVLDMHVARLIAAVDVVISSLSTLLLDAAIAGKPCIQYDTGNDLSYDGVASVEIEQLPQLLMNIPALPVNQALVKAYGEAADQPFYAHLARMLADAAPSVSDAVRKEIEADAASQYSAACEVEAFMGETQQLQNVTQTLRADLAVQTARADTAESNANQASARAVAAESEASQATARAIAAEAEASQATARAVAAEAEASQATARAVAAEAEANQATARAVAAESEASRATARAVAAEADAAQVRNELGALRSELGSVYGSRSWRLTAPYRFLGRCLKRGASSPEIISNAAKLAANELPTDEIFDAKVVSPDIMSLKDVVNFSLRQDIVKLLPAGALGVELGVALGTNSARLLKTGRFSHLFSIDMWAGDRGHDTEQYKSALSKLLPFHDKNTTLRMRFDEAVSLFPDNYFDLVYVDGYAHTGEENGQTFNEWWPKIKPGGIMAGDDYSLEAWPMVVAAVDRFIVENNLEFHILNFENKDDPFSQYPTWVTRKPCR
jgi:hypothetical protein